MTHKLWASKLKPLRTCLRTCLFFSFWSIFIFFFGTVVVGCHAAIGSEFDRVYFSSIIMALNKGSRQVEILLKWQFWRHPKRSLEFDVESWFKMCHSKMSLICLQSNPTCKKLVRYVFLTVKDTLIDHTPIFAQLLGQEKIDYKVDSERLLTRAIRKRGQGGGKHGTLPENQK